MSAAGNNTPEKAPTNTLSERVRSLRLTDSEESGAAPSWRTWLPWAICGILVCAAGDNVPRRRLDEITPEVWNHLIAVNLSGAFYFVNAGLRKLRESRGDVRLFVV